MSFPYHRVPDGSTALPHHFTWALLLAIPLLMVVWDNHPRKEPLAILSALTAALIAFNLVWPRYPTNGAALTLAVMAVCTLALAARLYWIPSSWSRWPLALALVLVLVAWDDLAQHAFGWHTPLDSAWKGWGRDLFQRLL